MKMDEWSEVSGFLATPGAYGLSSPVVLINTSISRVFLAGAHAYKIKKPIKLAFLDFSSAELRRAACVREVALNRRTAPSIYLGLVAITREPDGTLALDGKGAAIEWAVKMRRFDEEALLDRMAANGTLGLELIAKLARNIAAFHAALPPQYEAGGARHFRQTLLRNDAEYRLFQEPFFPASAIAALTGASLAQLDAQAALMDARKQAGWVRQCHGDMHLGNIFRLDGEPVLFDCIEFNDDIARIDILYDLAFLLMDLWRRGHKQHANHCLNQYLAHQNTADAGASIEALPLLPLFLSCRAGVRAFVMARAAQEQPDSAALAAAAREYFGLAQLFLRPAKPRLIAIGGLSGSGKSVLARSLAPLMGGAPGAVILRSDEIRKQLAGIDSLERLPPAAYSPQSNARVYARIFERARAALQAGHSVIADAVFSREEERRAIEAAASGPGAPFRGLWLDAPPQILESRVSARRHDASDADAAIVRQQLEYDTGTTGWPRIDASATPEETLKRSIRSLDDDDFKLAD